MSELLLGVGALTPCLVLAVAGALHARRPAELAAAIRAQDVLPARLAPAVARCVAGAELVLGGAGTALGPERLAQGPGLLVASGVAGLFAVFTLHSLFLLRTRVGAPCGCGGLEPPSVNGLVVGRAALLALAAGLAVTFREPLTELDLTASQFAIVVQASSAFALLLMLLPAAVAGVGR